MNISMDGKRIVAIYWPDTESEQGRCLAEQGSMTLELSATHHGDHDEFWIIEKHNGVTVANHNPRYVESIVWKT